MAQLAQLTAVNFICGRWFLKQSTVKADDAVNFAAAFSQFPKLCLRLRDLVIRV